MITVSIHGCGSGTTHFPNVKEIIEAEVGYVAFISMEGAVYKYFGTPYCITKYDDNQQKIKFGER